MKHTCHVPRCANACPPKHLMCWNHWNLVPTDMQDEVYKTVRVRAPRINDSWAPWWRAQARATHSVMVTEGRDKEACDKWLDKELKFADLLEKRP